MNNVKKWIWFLLIPLLFLTTLSYSFHAFSLEGGTVVEVIGKNGEVSYVFNISDAYLDTEGHLTNAYNGKPIGYKR